LPRIVTFELQPRRRRRSTPPACRQRTLADEAAQAGAKAARGRRFRWCRWSYAREWRWRIIMGSKGAALSREPKPRL